MVEVTRGLLPIDSEGVLLPSEDFSPKEAEAYPRLGGIKSIPVGPVGTKWGDPRVDDNAQIAAVLIGDWARLKLYRIVASPAPVGGGTERGLELRSLHPRRHAQSSGAASATAVSKAKPPPVRKPPSCSNWPAPTASWTTKKLPGKVIDLAGPIAHRNQAAAQAQRGGVAAVR